jgi:hypothetical protein
VGHRDPLGQLPGETGLARLAQHEGMQGNVGCQKAAAVGAWYLARIANMNACRVARVAGAVVTKMTMAGDVRVD